MAKKRAAVKVGQHKSKTSPKSARTDIIPVRGSSRAVPAGLPADYAPVLAELKARVRSAQLKAAVAVNCELNLLYWHIGREILRCQTEQGWGAKVVDRLSHDLRAEFPEMGGLSVRNLLRMRAFADAYPDGQIVPQLVAQIPWGHNRSR